MITEIFELDAIDFYDWEALEKLQEKRRKKLYKIYAKILKGDPKAKASLRKYREEESILKKRADVTGYYWI